VEEKRHGRDAQEEEILLQWGVRLAEEIESLSSQSHSSLLRQGHLQDALEEASVVLEMTGNSDLAQRASDLAEQLALLRRRIHGARIVAPSVDSVRRSARGLAREMKRRMEERLATSTPRH